MPILQNDTMISDSHSYKHTPVEEDEDVDIDEDIVIKDEEQSEYDFMNDDKPSDVVFQEVVDMTRYPSYEEACEADRRAADTLLALRYAQSLTPLEQDSRSASPSSTDAGSLWELYKSDSSFTGRAMTPVLRDGSPMSSVWERYTAYSPIPRTPSPPTPLRAVTPVICDDEVPCPPPSSSRKRLFAGSPDPEPHSGSRRHVSEGPGRIFRPYLHSPRDTPSPFSSEWMSQVPNLTWSPSPPRRRRKLDRSLSEAGDAEAPGQRTYKWVMNDLTKQQRAALEQSAAERTAEDEYRAKLASESGESRLRFITSVYDAQSGKGALIGSAATSHAEEQTLLPGSDAARIDRWRVGASSTSGDSRFRAFASLPTTPITTQFSSTPGSPKSQLLLSSTKSARDSRTSKARRAKREHPAKSTVRAQPLMIPASESNASRPCQCTVCEQSFRSTAQLSRHFRQAKHAGETPAGCLMCTDEGCWRIFSDKQAYDAHVQLKALQGLLDDVVTAPMPQPPGIKFVFCGGRGSRN